MKYILKYFVLYCRGVHLIVFVHGFQGNSFDMKLLKNNLCMFHPEALLLCSAANEENTENDIGDMGIKLANEVNLYIKETCPSNSLGRYLQYDFLKD